MAKVYKDFDAVFSLKEKTMTVKVFGNNYEIPAEIPAPVALKLSRMAKEDGEQQLDIDKLQEFLSLIYGEEVVEDWFKNNITTSQLSEILTWTMGQFREDAEGQSKNMKAPVSKKKK